jgi:hypothetical protein
LRAMFFLYRPNSPRKDNKVGSNHSTKRERRFGDVNVEKERKRERHKARGEKEI